MAPLTLPQVYRNARLRFVFVLLVALFFAVIGYAMAFGAEGASRLIGWAILLFFGVLFFSNLREFFDRSPRLTLTPTGITDRRLPLGEIAWADIAGATLHSRRGNHYVWLVLRNPEHYLPHLPALRRRGAEARLKQDSPPVSLDLTAVRADPPAVLATVRQLAGLPPE